MTHLIRVDRDRERVIAIRHRAVDEVTSPDGAKEGQERDTDAELHF